MGRGRFVRQQLPTSSSSSSSDEDDQPAPLPSSQTMKKPSSTASPSKQPQSSSESEAESSSSEQEEVEPQQPQKPTKDSSSSDDEEEKEGSSEEESSEEDSDSPPPPPPKKLSSSSVASPTTIKSKAKPKPKVPPPFSPTSGQEQHPAKTTPSAKESLEKPKKTTAERKRKTTETPIKEEVGNGPSAKKIFERLWNDDDLLVLLSGLEEFHSSHGHDPSNTADAAALLDMLDSRLKGDFAPSQLISKIRHTRRKYVNNLAKEREAAGSLVFPSLHERKVYELSKKVWGNATVAERASRAGKAKPSRTKAAVVTAVVEDRDDHFSLLERAMGVVLGEVWKHGAKSETLRRGLRTMRPEVIADFCEKLKELDLEEVRLWSRRLQLMSQILKSSEEVLANEAGV